MLLVLDVILLTLFKPLLLNTILPFQQVQLWAQEGLQSLSSHGLSHKTLG